MDGAELPVQGAPPDLKVASSVRLPPGRSVDATIETTESERQLMAAIENALLAPRPRRRGPRNSATAVPAPLLPPGCLGAGCLTREKLVEIALACKGERACMNEKISRLQRSIPNRTQR